MRDLLGLGRILHYCEPVLRSVHAVLLVAYVALVGLVEGPAEVLAVAALLTTLATVSGRGFRLGTDQVGVLAGVTAWALAGVPGTLLDNGPHSSGETTRPLLALTLFVGAWGIGRAHPRVLSKLAWAFGIACVVNAGYGLLQFLLERPLWLEPILLKNPRSAQIYVPNHVYHVRASSGLFYNRLKLAHVGVVGAVLIVLVGTSRSVRARTRLSAGVGALLLGPGLLFTYARMAFLAVVAAAVSVAAVLRRWLLLGIVGLVALGGGAAVLLSDAGRQRMSSLGQDLALRERMWTAAVDIFLSHPILGSGHGTYRNAVSALGERGLAGVHLTSPHNLWLQILAETGLVGFLGFNVAVTFALISVGRRVYRARTDARGRLDRLALISVLAILFIGLMHFPLSHAPVGLVFWTMIGVCVRTDEEPVDGEAEEAQD